MLLFIISDLRLFVRRRDLLLSVNGGAIRFKFYRYGLPDFASPNRFWTLFFVGTRMVILVRFVLTAMSSTMVGSPATSTRLFDFSSLEYYF
jgi:hypothetical protein